MAKYRKKPVVIEAMQWFKHGDHLMVRRVGNSAVGNAYHAQLLAEDKLGIIRTLEGDHYVIPGDWIICGVAGEYYPCKPEIFEATYELAE